MNVGIAGTSANIPSLTTMLVSAGATVTVHEPDADNAELLKSRITRHLERAARKGNVPEGLPLDPRSSVTVVEELDALAGCDIVCEVAGESLKAKLKLLQELDQACAGSAVIASITTSQSISRLASATSRPERVIGLHFATPIQSARVVEVIPGLRTSEETVGRFMAALRDLDRAPVLVRNRPGYVIGRVSQVFAGEALRLLEESAVSAETIDALARGVGFRAGPLESLDAVGLDGVLAAHRALYEASGGEPRYRPHVRLVEMVDAGLLGRKSERGFYAHESE
jgi:3-hydroxybutyryl-CoA dehydrogenase